MNDHRYLCRDIRGGAHFIENCDIRDRVSVYALLRVPGGTILVRDRTAGVWDLPGGGVERGETKAEALVREVQEEVGIIIDSEIEPLIDFTEYFFDIESAQAWRSHRCFYYATATESPEVSGNGDDISVAIVADDVRNFEISAVSSAIIQFADPRV